MAGETIKIPGIGETKKTYVYVGLAVVAGIVGYAWYAHSRNAGAAVGSDGLPTDSAGYADNYADLPGGTTGGTTTSGLGQTSTTTTPPNPDEDLSVTPTTNDQWVRQVTRILTEQFGFDGQMVSRVLGRYMDHQGLTTAEADLVRTAWGQKGRPPVGNFPIVTVPGTTTPPPATGGDSGGDTPRTPPATPPPAPPANKPPAPAKPKTATVLKGWHVSQWITDMHAQGLTTLGYEQLEALNPAMHANIHWDKDTTKTYFLNGATYRINP